MVQTWNMLSLWIFTSISAGAVEEVNQRYVIPSHSIACCGVGFSSNGQSLASGDLAGNIWITEKESYTPRHSFTVELVNPLQSYLITS